VRASPSMIFSPPAMRVKAPFHRRDPAWGVGFFFFFFSFFFLNRARGQGPPLCPVVFCFRLFPPLRGHGTAAFLARNRPGHHPPPLEKLIFFPPPRNGTAVSTVSFRRLLRNMRPFKPASLPGGNQPLRGMSRRPGHTFERIFPNSLDPNHMFGQFSLHPGF